MFGVKLCKHVVNESIYKMFRNGGKEGTKCVGKESLLLPKLQV